MFIKPEPTNSAEKQQVIDDAMGKKPRFGPHARITIHKAPGKITVIHKHAQTPDQLANMKEEHAEFQHGNQAGAHILALMGGAKDTDQD